MMDKLSSIKIEGMKKVKISKKMVNKLKMFKWLAVGLALIGLLYYFKANLVVAIVNGKPIWKISYTREVNKLAGPQILENLITNQLILQEAVKQNVKVSDEEIQAEINRYKMIMQQQGQDFDQMLTAQGLKIKEVEESIKTNKLIEKMAGTESAQIQEWVMNLQTNAKVIKWLKN